MFTVTNEFVNIIYTEMCTAPNQYGKTHYTELCNISHYSGHILKTEHFIQLYLYAHILKNTLCTQYIQSGQLVKGNCVLYLIILEIHLKQETVQ